MIEGISVEVRGGNMDQALAILKRKVVGSGLLREIKERRHFLSKGERRREKIRRSMRRIRKRELFIRGKEESSTR